MLVGGELAPGPMPRQEHLALWDRFFAARRDARSARAWVRFPARCQRTARSQSSAETAQVISDAAIRLFHARGYHGTSIRDIAGEANVGIATLFHHHGSKLELLRKIMTSGFDGLLAEMEEAVAAAGDDPTARLRAAVRTHVRRHCERPMESVDRELRDAQRRSAAARRARREGRPRAGAVLLRDHRRRRRRGLRVRDPARDRAGDPRHVLRGHRLVPGRRRDVARRASPTSTSAWRCASSARTSSRRRAEPVDACGPRPRAASRS